MAMSDHEKREKVQRLVTAHKKTKDALEREPVSRELHAGSDIARKWPVITAAYSGLEQTLKYLIAEEKHKGIAELIGFREKNRYPYQTHNVAWLFSELENPAQEVLRDFYGRYQSLHSYITVETVDEFLRIVSEPRGRGYERWRYSLIEDRDREIPKNSPEGLVAIWGVSVEVAEERAWGKQRVRMPDEELTTSWGMEFDDMVMDVAVDRQNAGEPFQDIEREFRDWAWKKGHPLNSFADVLWHFSRYEEHGQTGMSEWLSEAVTKWAKAVVNNPAMSGRTAMRTFVERAQGNMPDGQSLRWNRDAQRFEAIPWSLEHRHQKVLPLNAIVIGNPGDRGSRLRTLWQAAKRSGYRVVENRAFYGAPASDDSWFRTLEIQADEEGEARPILSMWQKRIERDDLYYMVEQRPRDEIDDHVHRWMELAQRIGELRTGQNGQGHRLGWSPAEAAVTSAAR